MRDRLQQCLTGFFIAVGSCAGIVPALAVDDVRLQAASNATTDWLTYGHTYDNQRFSTLDQINRNSVSRLAPRWIYQTGISATFLASPVVADGVMYLSTPLNDVVALDATAMRLVGLDPYTCRHACLAQKAGLGSIDSEVIEVDGPMDEYATTFEPAEKDLPIKMLGVISHSRFLTERLIMNPEAFFPLRSVAMVFRSMRDGVLRTVGAKK